MHNKYLIPAAFACIWCIAYAVVIKKIANKSKENLIKTSGHTPNFQKIGTQGDLNYKKVELRETLGWWRFRIIIMSAVPTFGAFCVALDINKYIDALYVFLLMMICMQMQARLVALHLSTDDIYYNETSIIFRNWKTKKWKIFYFSGIRKATTNYRTGTRYITLNNGEKHQFYLVADLHFLFKLKGYSQLTSPTSCTTHRVSL